MPQFHLYQDPSEEFFNKYEAQITYPVQYKNFRVYKLDRKKRSFVLVLGKSVQKSNCADRNEALRLGERHYITGRPCNRGHVDKRYTSSMECMTCNRERYKAVQSTVTKD